MSRLEVVAVSFVVDSNSTGPDLRLHATYYRTALLLGLLKGEAVLEWAHDVIEHEASPPTGFLELAMIPAFDLSALRHALWPLGIDPEPPNVVRAVLGLIAADAASGRRTIPDTVTVLRQLRSLVSLPPELSETIGVLVNTHMLAIAGLGDRPAKSEDTIAQWLTQFSGATLSGEANR